MANDRSRLQSMKVFILLNQPSILLLGLSTILAFMALTRFQEKEEKLVIYIAWSSIFVFILLWRVLRWYLSPSDFSQNKDVIDIFVKITGGALVLLTIYFSWINFKLTQDTSNKTLEVSQQTLESSQSQKVNDQFTKALEDLGEKSLFHHLAGIFSFRRMEQRILNEADYAARYEEKKKKNDFGLERFVAQRAADKKLHFEVMDILTHFIQEASPVRRKPELSASEAPDGLTLQRISGTNTDTTVADTQRKCPVDVYEILKLVGQRNLTYKNGEPDPLNLVSTDLRGCNSFKNGNFNGVRFSGANLTKTDFENASLREADLENVDFTGANLKNADLTGAKLDSAALYGADLKGAKLGPNDSLDNAYADNTTVCPDGFRYDQENNTCARNR